MNMKSKLFALLCALAMLAGTVSVPVFADGTTASEPVYNADLNCFFANGTPITISAGADGTTITWEGGSEAVPNNVSVFGGGHNTDAAMATSITMAGGTVRNIFGGGLHQSNVTSSSVTMTGGTVTEGLMGGGASSTAPNCGCELGASYYNGDAMDSPCRVEDATVAVSGGSVFTLFGGGQGISYTGTADVTVSNDADVEWATAGGSNGYTGTGTLNIQGGTIYVAQGVNRGSMDSIEINMTDGEVTNLYAGGETSDASVNGTYTKATVAVDGGTVGTLSPGSNGVAQVESIENAAVTVAEAATVTSVAEGFELNEEGMLVQYAAQIGDVKYETLGAAFSAASGTATITMLKDVTGCSAIDVTRKNVTLDLNGFDIGFAYQQNFSVYSNGQLHLTGSGKVYEEEPYFAPVMQKGALMGANTSVVTVGKDVTLEGWAGLFIDKNGAYNSGVSATVYGKLISQPDADGYLGSALYVNGSIVITGANAPKILLDGATLLAPNGGNGMYLAGYADTTIVDSTIEATVEGNTGIEIRAGKLNITNSTVKGGTGEFNEEPNGNGSTIFNAALAVAQHTSKLPLEVTVNSGTFTGTAALYQRNIQDNDGEAVAKVKLDIVGGDFVGQVYSENKSGFITGGTFTEQPAEEYCADGYAPVANDEGGYGVVSEYLASIGDQKYKTLDALVEAANAMGETPFTIKFLKSFELPVAYAIQSTQNITFDLNGQTITVAKETADRSYYAINNYGTVTIEDSSAAQTGTVIARGVRNLDDGKMTINSGTIISCDENGGACVWNEADLTINGGTFETVFVGTPGDNVGIGCVNNSGMAQITGGTFKDVNRRTYAIISTGYMEITPADGREVIVEGAHGGISSDGGTLVINGGSYSSSDYYGLYVSNDGNNGTPMQAAVTVNGGTFTGKTYSVWIGSDVNDPVNSTIEITNGVFEKPLNAQENTREGAIKISGGTFSDPVPAEYCAPGFEPVENDDVYGVAPVANAISANAVDAIKEGAEGTIRFITKVDKLTGTASSFGTYILPLDVFEKNNNNWDLKAVVEYKRSINEDDTYAADLTGLPEKYFNEEIMAQSFMVVEGAEKAVICDFDAVSVNGAMQ